MRRISTTPIRHAALLLTGFMLSMPWTASAQTELPPLVAIRLVETVPGKALQFEAALKKFGAAIAKVDEGRGFGVRQIAVGGPGNAYVVFRGIDSIADLKPRNVIAEAFGDDEAAATLASINAAVAQTRVEIFARADDLGMPPSDLEGIEAVYVIRVDVAIGGNQAFEDYMHKLVEATNKVAPDQTWFGYRPGIGAGNTYRFAIPMKWADAEPGMSIPERLAKHFGDKEAAKILAARDAVVVEANSSLSTLRPDLSAQAAQ